MRIDFLPYQEEIMAHYNSGVYGGYKYSALPIGLRGIFGGRIFAWFPYWTGSKPKFKIIFTPIFDQTSHLGHILVYVKSPDYNQQEVRIELSAKETTTQEINKFGVTSNGETVFFIGDSKNPSENWLVRVRAITNDGCFITVFVAMLSAIVGALLGALGMYYLAIMYGIGA